MEKEGGRVEEVPALVLGKPFLWKIEIVAQ